MPITIHRPRKPQHNNDWRIGDYMKILTTPVGTTGIPEVVVSQALIDWEPDTEHPVNMDYELPASSKLWFIKHNENPQDFTLIQVGKYNQVKYARAVLFNIHTGNLVFRSATFETLEKIQQNRPKPRKRHKSIDPEWLVEPGIFNANYCFWSRLKNELCEPLE